MAYNVFISYSTKDLPVAERIRGGLANLPVDVFIAEYSVSPGSRLNDTIVAAIKRCDLFLLLWTGNSKASEYVSQEIGVARGSGKRILPMVMEDGLELPGLITDLKYLPAYRSLEQSLEWLQEHILDTVEKRRQKREQQRQKDKLILFVLGALVVLAVSQK